MIWRKDKSAFCCFTAYSGQHTDDSTFAVRPAATPRWFRSSSSQLCCQCGLLVSLLFLFCLFNNSSTVERMKQVSFFGDQCSCLASEQVSTKVGNATTGDSEPSFDSYFSNEYAVFYHAFIDTNRVRFSYGIVAEQLAQWQNSNLAKATLYYGLVGKSSRSFPCPHKATCRELYRQSEGWEVNTLQKLYEYCVANPTHNAVYLHSKGSYHDNKNNHILRRVLTRSAVSDECLVGLASGSCDVCSARFSALPRWHVTGNMWTATCKHVAALIPPANFEAAVRGFVQKYADQERNGSMPDEPSVGMGRFSDEHWIHTYPRVRPCDVFTSHQLKWGYPPLDENDRLELQAAPRWPLENFKGGMDPLNPLFRLKYRLAELHHLYNAVPPIDHFTWKQYVEGNMV